MSYLVLARKFRPQTFGDVCGQEHVTRTLVNSIRRGRVAHAYLFAGPRGVGKTSVARIFAKALNCKEFTKREAQAAGGVGADGGLYEPCSVCSNCIEIAQGSNLAVREIDGASHNSVENVRDLIDSFRALPPPGSLYKIYIIDEVHMFSSAAFNALLKSLEEPPPHTVFILATTEAHKIPETVISRCQRHDFRSLGQGDIEDRLRMICQEEGAQVEPEALRMVARLSDGSMRDAQSLLERVNAFCDGAVSAANASLVLGTVERSILSALSRAVLTRQANVALDLVSEVFSKGVDPGLFLREFATHFRELLLARFGGGDALTRLGVGEADRVEFLRQAGSVDEQDLQDLVQLVYAGCDSAMRSAYPKYALEALVVRMATREPAVVIAEVLSSLRDGSFRSDPGGPTHSVAPSRPTQPGTARVPERLVRQSEAPAPVASATAEQAAGVAERELDWSAFVQEVARSSSRIVAEHLRRVSVRSFSIRSTESSGSRANPASGPGEGGQSGDTLCGVLEGLGPAFSVESLLSGENKSKVEDLLKKFSGVGRWNIKFSIAQDPGLGVMDGAASDSILGQDRERGRRSRAEREAEIANHPKIQDLKKIFPGTKIETITIKEE